jgi:acyl carrier protein
MKLENILKKLISIIAEQLELEEADKSMIVEGAHFIDDLGADSLDIVEILMSAEEMFNVQIADEDLETINTVGDLVNVIYFKKNHNTSRREGSHAIQD